ncbi:hypothetical protein ABVF61_13735 [Roseibium sp. HPY-6]|uniref:hypothetical protein n=1 Tax=Roseibium sp. HPY-6 TaxID=3229852 RepID=UPI00338F1AB1
MLIESDPAPEANEPGVWANKKTVTVWGYISSANFNVSDTAATDEKVSEPEVDVGEPGPLDPEPAGGNDDASHSSGTLGGGDIILVDIVGSSASEAGQDLAVPTGAGKVETATPHTISVVDGREPSSENALGGDGEIILVDIVGASAGDIGREHAAGDDLLFEPETDDSEPGPHRPHPTNDAGGLPGSSADPNDTFVFSFPAEARSEEMTLNYTPIKYGNYAEGGTDLAASLKLLETPEVDPAQPADLDGWVYITFDDPF